MEEFQFPLPQEILLKLMDLEQRINRLEGEKIPTHRVGPPGPFSIYFEEKQA